MFKALVESVGLYGAEIWGWRRRDDLDSLQRKYLKWILGLDRTTANYLVQEETKEIATSLIALKRAAVYEERSKLSDKQLVKACIDEIEREKSNQEEGKWENCRKVCWRNVNLEKGERDRVRGQKESVVKLLCERWGEKDKEARKTKIDISKSNRRYKELMTEKIPEYLTKDMKGYERNLLARFRLGNEERANKYWMQENERMCRVCMTSNETLEHVMAECVDVIKTDLVVRDILNADGRGITVLKEIVRIRNQRITEAVEQSEQVK